MARETRRDLLRWLAGAGSMGLAGCQESESHDSSTTSTSQVAPETSTSKDGTTTGTEGSELNRVIGVDVTVSEGESSILLEVIANVTSPNGIESITIETAEDTASIGLSGLDEYSVEETLSVGGGQSYSISVVVTESDDGTFEQEIETDYVPIFLKSVPQPDRLVGAHYYPWYEMHGGHQDWTDRCVADPLLGEYSADDPAVIDQHLAWCLEHGIRWLSISWWGPGTGTDAALKDAILEAERFEDIEFSILYETKGRLESFDYDLDDSATRDRLIDDLQYLEEHYFTRENYLRFDGRPVLFLYIANALKGDLQAGFAEGFEALETRPYILADLPTGVPPSNYQISQVADAATDYNPYSAREDIDEVFHDLYKQHSKMQQLGSEAIDMDYVPVVIPGYNDTGIPDNQREDNPVLSASPERYARVIDQVSQHLRQAQAVLVTSFNEWYENTEIEPNETYGTQYLELTRDNLATGESPGYETQGTKLRLAFNKTIVPAEVNTDSEDERELAFQLGGLRFVQDGEEMVSYDIGDPSKEPTFLEGVFPPGSHGEMTWRWLGGFTKESTLLVEVDVGDAGQAVLVGQPMRSDVIEATIYFDGVETDYVEFRERDGEFDEYVVELVQS